jgi:site-specific DNA-methyltransferase (adenine-specific)
MIKLLFGDCLEKMDSLIEKGIKFDAVITDPPYGTTACKWDTIIPFDEIWSRLKQLRKERTPIVLFGSEPFSSLLRVSNLKEFKYDWVWNKKVNGAFTTVKFRPGVITENISVFGKTINYFPIMTNADPKNIRPPTTNSSISEAIPIHSGIVRSSENYNEKKRYPVNIIEYSKFNAECNNKHRKHPTQKPVALLEYLIKTYTNEGDLVLDFTMGSGTTGVACKNLNRNFIGIENDKKYFEIAKKRIEELENNLFKGL